MDVEHTHHDPGMGLALMDLLGRALNREGHPSEAATSLARELRTLVRARCVILYRCQPGTIGGGRRLLGLSPEELRPWAESAVVQGLDEALPCLSRAVTWHAQDPTPLARRLAEQDLAAAWPCRCWWGRPGWAA